MAQANIGQSLQWDAVPGAADYRVRAVDVNGAAFGSVVTTPATTVPLADVLGSGPPTPETYTLFVAARDSAGTLGSEAQMLVQLQALPAPTGLTIV